MFQRLVQRPVQFWFLCGGMLLTGMTWLLTGWVQTGQPAAPLSLGMRLAILSIILLSLGMAFCLRLLWQGAGKASSLPPAGEDSQQLKAAFADAIDVLHNPAWGGRKRNRYDTPWYMMLGASGAGKTSVLLNSGLDFPLAERFGRHAADQETRFCDWWFSNDAVFIDLAGRYTTQNSGSEQDRLGWHTLLGLLRRYRRRQPINGVILTVSLEDFLTASPEQRSTQARTLRARLDELATSFGVNLPIYLLWTKADLLAGFAEYFSDLRGDAAEQVWGFTLPSQVPSMLSPDGIGNEFRALLTRLNARLLERLQAETSAEKKAHMLGFPQQYEIILPLLSDFLAQTFSSNRYTRQPTLRGVYFCSARQEGVPLDCLTPAVAPQFSIAGAENERGTSRSYFLRQFFQSVLIPEANLMGGNRQQEQQLVWLRRASFAALGGFSVLLAALWGRAYFAQQHFVEDIQHRLSGIQLQASQLKTGAALNETADLMAATRQIVTLSAEQADRSWRFIGLQDNRLHASAQLLYRRLLTQVFLPSLGNSIKQRFTQANEQDLYAHLRAYLMLVHPEHREMSYLSTWLDRFMTERNASPAQTKLLVTALFDAAPAARLASPDEMAIKQARAVLLAQPLPQRVYQQLKAQHAGETIDIRQEANFDFGTTFRIKGRANPYLVPKLFTKPGYQQLNLAEAIEQLKKDRWMWGEAAAFSDENLVRTETQVRALYLAEYTEHWRNLLENLEIPAPGNLNEGVGLMRRLTAVDQSPLLQMLKTVQFHTGLTEPSKLAESVAKQVGLASSLQNLAIQEKPTLVDLQFRTLNAVSIDTPQRAAPINNLLQSLRETQEFLSSLASAPDVGEMALKITKGRLQGNQDPLQKFALVVKDQPQPIQRWLSGLVYSANTQLSAAAGTQLNRLWRDQVVSVWEQRLAGRYPFVRTAKTDVPLQDFAAFFKPQGVVDGFVREHLGHLADTSGNVGASSAQALGISASALNAVRQAYLIQAAFFGADPAQPKVLFRLKPTAMDDRLARFSLTLGDQQLEYSHGPKIPREFTWPGGQADRVRLRFDDLNQTPFHQSIEGEWAWFHLIETVTKSTSAGAVTALQFKGQNKTAEFELSLKQAANAFDSKLLSQFDCPRSL